MRGIFLVWNQSTQGSIAAPKITATNKIAITSRIIYTNKSNRITAIIFKILTIERLIVWFPSFIKKLL
ncbi:MAG: hypothetical protein KKC23_01315, partial [Proteobacteria bacterium]|nr:hypothetical protein [Pseudomonadota bacterium]